VGSQLSQRDRTALLGEFRYVPLNGRVEVELTALGEPQRGRGCQQFRDAAESIECVRRRRRPSLAIGLALGVRNENASALADSHRQRRNVRTVAERVYVPLDRRTRNISDVTRGLRRRPSRACFQEQPGREEQPRARDSLMEHGPKTSTAENTPQSMVGSRRSRNVGSQQRHRLE
jgi:hypothetical protein